MTKQDFIQTSHEAQSGAGSLTSFNQKVTKYMYAEFTAKADPVAAFLGALLAINDNANQAIEDFNFYYAELLKVRHALSEMVKS